MSACGVYHGIVSKSTLLPIPPAKGVPVLFVALLRLFFLLTSPYRRPKSEEVGKHLWRLPALITLKQDWAERSMAAQEVRTCATFIPAIEGPDWGLLLYPKGHCQSVRVLSISDTVIKAALCKYWIAFNAYLCASSLDPATASVTTRM